MENTNHRLLLDSASSGNLHDVQTVKHTIQQKEFEGILNEFQQNALHLACLYNFENVQVAFYLRDYTFDLLSQDYNGASPVMYACQNGLQEFVTSTVNTDYMTKKHLRDLFSQTDTNGDNILFYCVKGPCENKTQKIELLQYLIDTKKQLLSPLEKLGTFINQSNRKNYTVLKYAVENENYEAIQALKQFHAVIKHDNYEVKYAPWLIINTPNPGDEFIQTLVRNLSNDEKSECLFIVLKSNVITGIEDKQKNLPLRIKWTEALISDIEPKVLNYCQTNCKTALQLAYEKEYMVITKAIKNKGGKIFIWEEKCWAGLLVYHARKSFLSGEFPDLQKYIKEYGGGLEDIKETDSMGQTILHHISKLDHPRDILGSVVDSGIGRYMYDVSKIRSTQLKFTDQVIRHGADIDPIDHLGCTPLFYALQQNNRDIVRRLLKAGADPGVKTKFGISPLNIGSNIIQNLMQRDVPTESCETLYSNAAREFISLGMKLKTWNTPCKIVADESENLDKAVDILVRLSGNPEICSMAKKHEDILNLFFGHHRRIQNSDDSSYVDPFFAIENLRSMEYSSVPILSEAEAEKIKSAKDPIDMLIREIPKLSPLALPIFALKLKNHKQPDQAVPENFLQNFLTELQNQGVDLVTLEETKRSTPFHPRY